MGLTATLYNSRTIRPFCKGNFVALGTDLHLTSIRSLPNVKVPLLVFSCVAGAQWQTQAKAQKEGTQKNMEKLPLPKVGKNGRKKYQTKNWSDFQFWRYFWLLFPQVGL